MIIIWSPLSVIQFKEIENYLKINFGSNSASEFSFKLLKAIHLIAQNPYIGKKIHDEVRALVIVKQITMHYRISTHIKILTLWDNRQMPID